MNIPPEVVLQYTHCSLGCPKDDEVILTGCDLIHNLPGEFTVVKCRNCGLMRTNPRPTPETMGFYYPDDYGPYLGTQIPLKQPSSIKRLIKPAVKWIFNFNTKLFPQLPPGRLLEVGCASGSFLHERAGAGWQVEGIEFSAKAAHAATRRGYRVHAGPLETAPEPDQPYDLIVGWMVLEHLHDPVECLCKLSQWAKPGAWLVLSIPNAASLEFHFFKERWYGLHLPNHLCHFTPETLAQVLQAGGWSMERIYHQRTLTNLIVSTGYVLRDKGYAKLGQKLIDFPLRSSGWSYALYPLAWLLSLFGQTGRMTVWAKKSDLYATQRNT